MNIKIIHEPLFTYGSTPGYEDTEWDIDMAIVIEEVWEAYLRYPGFGGILR